jgi:predicted enzyme related to lactoylglutathione lyase
MPKVSKHPHGAFCWAELVTSDQSSAKTFYAKLFGWTAEDSPMSNDAVYTMLKLNGSNVGALYQRGKDQQNVPPHWNCYVTVDNVDESAKNVGALGGKSVLPPFDVLDVGRMSVLQDPAGAMLSLWQPKKHIGAQIINEPGAMCWQDLGTSDEKLAGKFYSQLFGWGTKLLPVTPPYTVFSNAGTDIGGMYLLDGSMAGIPPHWLPYFQVHDCDAAASKAISMGGKAIVPPTDISVGRFAYLQDAQGAMFAVIKLNPMP